MSSLNLDPISVFDQSFPRDLQRSMVDILRQLYGDSPNATKSIVAQPHHKDLHPHVRRALIEERLERLASGHPGISVRPETNRSGNTHIVIEGPNIILTESFARSPKKVVRWAAYRMADSMQNYPLFRDLEPADELKPSMKFNAVLLHGHSSHDRQGQDRSELRFAVIRFPHPGFKAYLPELINLLDRFPAGAFVAETEAVEEIDDAIGTPKIITDRPIRMDS